MKYSLVITSSPASEPVTVTEVKSNSRIDTSEDDTLIGTLIQAAREYVEKYCNTTLINTTYVLRMADFPYSRNVDDGIKLPRSPVNSITSIVYNDLNGDSQTWSSSLYTADIYSKPAVIVPAYGESYPSCRGHVNDVAITYVAGYGATASSVPQEIKQAMLLLIGHWYENREAVVVGTTQASLSFSVEALLSKYRILDGWLTL